MKSYTFECTQCAKCCKTPRGVVYLEAQDIARLAKALKIPRLLFLLKYARRIDGKWALRKKWRSIECTFLDGKLCRVYKDRPAQCHLYPFFPETLADPEAWDQMQNFCEGFTQLGANASRAAESPHDRNAQCASPPAFRDTPLHD
ncbi:MAG: YkgJ family cysteine cluster protein [Simkaniaceae bacterium]|nr:YkgJ family cysteine cluster protein [Simkaniaceae bacterium]